MAHEITPSDNVVLHNTRAWHGLGIIVKDAPTPTAACKLAGLDWQVEQWPLSATFDGQTIPVPGFANVRSDMRKDPAGVLGTVSKWYQPIQNSDLAEFAELLAKEGDVVKCETAGSIQGGKKVWFLLKGESFSVRSHAADEIAPYILVSNGHDGATALRCTPTTIRVVCSNTLHMVIPRHESDRMAKKNPLASAAYVGMHMGDLKKRVIQAREALGLYQTSLKATREVIDGLAARDMNSDQVNRFLLECYASAVKPIPVDPKTDSDKKTREKAVESVKEMIGWFEKESPISGTNAWTAYNAFSGWLQHRPTTTKDQTAARDGRIGSQLFGEDADRCHKAINLACSL
jgi:phage/plasmid-like protein (TIGR03299 family)